MSSQSLSTYFNTIVEGSQQFIDELPDEFLHDCSKTAYQLINEVKVYLRSGGLTNKERDIVTKKVEQLIEEVELLEIAYESWNGKVSTEKFSADFKAEFDEVLQKPTIIEIWNTYMGWQETGVMKFSIFINRVEVPVLFGVIGFSFLIGYYGINTESMFGILLVACGGLFLGVIKYIIRLGWIPFFSIIVLIYIFL